MATYFGWQIFWQYPCHLKCHALNNRSLSFLSPCLCLSSTFICSIPVTLFQIILPLFFFSLLSHGRAWGPWKNQERKIEQQPVNIKKNFSRLKPNKTPITTWTTNATTNDEQEATTRKLYRRQCDFHIWWLMITLCLLLLLLTFDLPVRALSYIQWDCLRLKKPCTP